MSSYRNTSVRPETQTGAGVLFSHRAGLLQFIFFVAVAEADRVFLAITAHAHIELFGQRIDHRHPNPMKSAGKNGSFYWKTYHRHAAW